MPEDKNARGRECQPHFKVFPEVVVKLFASTDDG